MEYFSRLFTNVAYLAVLLVCGVLLYMGFGESIMKEWNKPSTLTPEQIELQEIRLIQLKAEKAYDKVENGIHVRTGLAYDENFQLVSGICTACHSAKLVTQNKATREGWKEMIVWMQETQGLQDLGANEVIVLDYLAEHYAPKAAGRRPNLDVEAIEWYILKELEVE